MMNPETGKLYPSLEEALKDGVVDPVEIVGSSEAIERISRATKDLHAKEKRKAKRKQQRASRKKNR